MRILFFLHNVSKTRHFDTVLEALAERGHSVVLAAARQRNRALALPKNLRGANERLIARRAPGRIEIVPCPVRRVDEWSTIAPALRQARDFLRIFDPRYARADKLASRSAAAAPPWWRRFIEEHPVVRQRWRLVSRLLAVAEKAIPTDRLFDLFIAYEQPDLVLVTPLVDYGSYQTDYVKSAHRLGVPVVFAPFSWDNLTNRGLIRVQPDRVLVWNDGQQREAVELHGVPPERVVITGASRFDAFFGMSASTTREAFCGAVGLDPATPLLLYVCSSEFVAPREVEFVRRWIAALRASADPALRSCGVLVRPHPAHLKQWKSVHLAVPNVALWSEKETMNADQGLYDSLHHCAAVVGLNTSAMIEASILGRPVHTILAAEFGGGQEQTLHFHHLRAQNGGPLHEARDFAEHLEQLGATLAREGAGRDEARRFVERFVRPRGGSVSVTPVIVEEIERAARIRKRPQPRAPLWAYAAGLALRAAAAGRRVLAGEPDTARPADPAARQSNV